MTAENLELDLPEPVLTIGGRSFRCRPAVPYWHMMKLAKAYKSDDVSDAMAGMVDFLEKIIDPEVWDEFDAHMSTTDVDLGTLDKAIGDALASMAGRGKDEGPSSSPSSTGSESTSTPSRVVSFSRGTVEVQPSLSDAVLSSQL